MTNKNLLSELPSVKTFQELESLYINKDEIDYNMFMSTYVYLITDSWIIQDGGYEALQSARRCRDFILARCHEKIKKLNQTAATIFILPPEKLILTKANTYKKLESLFLAETKDISDLTNFNGTDYAKQYWFILKAGPIGINGNPEEEANYCISCARLIAKTQLTDEYRQKMQNKFIAENLKGYTDKKNGCLNFIIFFIVIGIASMLI